MICSNKSYVTSDFQHFWEAAPTLFLAMDVYIYISSHESGAGKTSPAITGTDSWGSLEMPVNLAITDFILNFVSFLEVLQGYSGREEKAASGGEDMTRVCSW